MFHKILSTMAAVALKLGNATMPHNQVNESGGRGAPGACNTRTWGLVELRLTITATAAALHPPPERACQKCSRVEDGADELPHSLPPHPPCPIPRPPTALLTPQSPSSPPHSLPPSPPSSFPPSSLNLSCPTHLQPFAVQAHPPALTIPHPPYLLSLPAFPARALLLLPCSHPMCNLTHCRTQHTVTRLSQARPSGTP